MANNSGMPRRDSSTAIFCSLPSGFGAGHVQIGAHLAGAHALELGIVEPRIQRLAAAAGALHELADLFVQRHLLEQRFGTGGGLRVGMTCAGQNGDDKAGHCGRGDSGSTREILPSMRWLESTRSRGQSNLARNETYTKRSLAGACMACA